MGRWKALDTALGYLQHGGSLLLRGFGDDQQGALAAGLGDNSS